MNTIQIEYPETWLPALGTDRERFARDARVASAMKLFEVGRLSSGQAAQFAGISRVEFLLTSRHWCVPSVAWDERECREEFATQVS